METSKAVKTGRVLDRTTGTHALSFTADSPQLWHDDWRNTDRIMRYYGECSACGRRVYGFDDGENDPRGVLGDHAEDCFYLSEHLSDDDAAEVKRVGDVWVRACFLCTNDYDRYTSLVNYWGLRKARAKGANV